jgi:hypothetical protein
MLTLKLRTEALAPMVAVGREVEAQPVLAADDRGRKVHAREPGEEREERNLPCKPTEQISRIKLFKNWITDFLYVEMLKTEASS